MMSALWSSGLENGFGRNKLEEGFTAMLLDIPVLLLGFRRRRKHGFERLDIDVLLAK